MKIVIIEDESLTAKDLAATILELQPGTEIAAMLSTVKDAIRYFQQEERPDLVFSDIQLEDGLSFDIFTQVPVQAPVIFCTAYDEYALQAFKANGIDYILKPFTNNMVATALHKYEFLKEQLVMKTDPFASIKALLSNRKTTEQGAVLVYYKDRILPVATNDIAVFYTKNSVVHLTTFDGRTYTVNKNMEELEKATEPLFFRVNRQFLVHRKAVVDASSYLSRKLSVTLSVPVPEVVTVSKEKMPQFLQWLTQA